MSRTDGEMRPWVEEWKGGWADQQGPSGRLTQTQEVPLLCGKCFIITSMFLPRSPLLPLYVLTGSTLTCKGLFESILYKQNVYCVML